MPVGETLSMTKPTASRACVQCAARKAVSSASAVGNWFKQRFMISPEQGAQMPLICATQPHLESGGYWHNVHGRMQLAPDDPARDGAAAARLWETCEALGSV